MLADVTGSPVALLLLALALILVAAQVAGAVFSLLAQPPVVGEMIAGFCLGPPLLGALAPRLQGALFAPRVVTHIEVLAELGVVLFMFLVGVELDVAHLRKASRASVAISHAGIALPFALGAAVAWIYAGQWSPAGIGRLPFSAFVGCCMAVTAFPVLARILRDTGLADTPVGGLVLACAAVDDVTAWCLLAAVVGLVKGDFGATSTTLLGTVVYVLAMWFLARPLLERYLVRPAPDKAPTPRVFGSMLALLFISTVVTRAIGIHGLFGAFMLGLIIPKDSGLARSLVARLDGIAAVLLLPTFFALTGLRLRLDLLSNASDWWTCGGLLLVASGGKFGGTFLASRLSGLAAADATAVGVLMNTRGLMELVVLNIGLELGVLTPRFFSMMVLVALITTFATTPLLHLIGYAKLRKPSTSPHEAPQLA